MNIIKRDTIYNYPDAPMAAKIASIAIPAVAMFLLMLVVSAIVSTIFMNIDAVNVGNTTINGQTSFDNNALNENFAAFSYKNAAKINTIIQMALIVIFAPMFLRNKRKFFPIIQRKSQISYLIIAVMAIVSVFGFGVLADYFSALILGLKITGVRNQMIDNEPFWLILGACVVGPILEEIVFRGLVLNRALSIFNKWSAIFISATLFGILHTSVYQMLSAFCVGLLLAFVYIKLRSIVICILAHSATNVLALVLNNLYSKSKYLEDSTKLVLIIAGIASAIGIVVLVFSKNVPLKRNEFMLHPKGFIDP